MSTVKNTTKLKEIPSLSVAGKKRRQDSREGRRELLRTENVLVVDALQKQQSHKAKKHAGRQTILHEKIHAEAQSRDLGKDVQAKTHSEMKLQSDTKPTTKSLQNVRPDLKRNFRYISDKREISQETGSITKNSLIKRFISSVKALLGFDGSARKEEVNQLTRMLMKRKPKPIVTPGYFFAMSQK